MNRPPLKNVSDDAINYILYLEEENGKLKAEIAELQRKASLEKMKASVNKKNLPPSSNGHNYPRSGIIIHK